jgi:hypothetical protein
MGKKVIKDSLAKGKTCDNCGKSYCNDYEYCQPYDYIELPEINWGYKLIEKSNGRWYVFDPSLRGGYIDIRDPFYYNMAGGSYYTNYPGSLDKKWYLDILIEKIEYYSLADVQQATIDYHVDEVEKKFVLNNEPDPYSDQEIYILHYRQKATFENVPDYHYEYLFSLASAVLLERQAMALSKITQTTGPGLKSQFVSPMVLFEMAKKLKEEVSNALSRYIPERG